LNPVSGKLSDLLFVVKGVVAQSSMHQVSELISKKKHTLIPLDYLDNFFSHDKSLAFLFNFRQKVVGMGQK
jgi:hypothetical protein